MPTYFTHDNGGRPYKVVVGRRNNKKIIKIYKQNKHDDTYSGTPLVYSPKKIFIGRSGLNEMTKYSGGSGKAFDGNSILLKMSEKNYIYIGVSVTSFKSFAKITRYKSHVGNSDVPYPYAIDINKNYYLIIENVVISRVPPKYNKSPYEYYYRGLDRLDSERLKKGLKLFQDITIFLVGDRKINFHYAINPSRRYNELRKRGKLYIVKLDCKKYKLSKPYYIKLMHMYRRLGYIKPIRGIKQIN